MKTISDIAREVTAEFLAKLTTGFYRDGNYRHDPLPWDINQGYCEEWATEVAWRYNQEGDRTAAITGMYMGLDEPWHTYVILDGKYYDAEAPDGVDDPSELPIYEDNPRPSP